MTQPFRLLSVPVAAVLAGGLFAASCGSSASPLSIIEFDSVTASDGACTPGTSISRSTLFAGDPDCCSYVVGFKVQNDLQAITETVVQGQPPLHIDEHEVTIEKLTTTYKFVGSSPVTLKSETTAAYAVMKSGGQQAQFLGQVLSAANGAALAGADGELDITIVASGRTRDGTPVASPPVTLPLTVTSATSPTCKSTEEKKGCTSNQLDGYECVAKSTM